MHEDQSTRALERFRRARRIEMAQGQAALATAAAWLARDDGPTEDFLHALAQGARIPFFVDGCREHPFLREAIELHAPDDEEVGLVLYYSIVRKAVSIYLELRGQLDAE